MSKSQMMQVKLPPNFDANKHQALLMKKIADSHGEGFELLSIDPGKGVAYVTRQVTVTEVTASASSDSFEVLLAHGTKPTDGEKAEAKFMDQYPGYYMTRFEPFLGRATLTRMSDDEARCRGAVAVALGSKPWDVQVKARPDGGFDLNLPRTYQPSKADKLDEVATQVVGRNGWYAKIDAQRLTASLIPADPPTFPSAIPTPMKRLGRGDVMSTPFGWQLPGPGEKTSREAVVDWRASGSALVSGLAGGGKTVTITAILADRVANGAFLAVIDTADKSVDYTAFKDMCGVEGVDGKFIPGWGCDTLGDAVAVLAMLCEEGQKRAKVLADLGINNWLDLPPDKAFRPIFIIADEYEALVTRMPEPKALPKDHPIRLEAIEENMAHDLIGHFMNRIVKEFRFVGLNPLISTQVSNASTGLPPSLKGKMGHFVLCGSTPSEAARKQSFPDASGVPHVPDHVASGGAVARGTGSAKIEGAGSFVFKSYFAPVNDYRAALLTAGVKTYDVKKVSPTQRQIDKYLPRLGEDEDSGSGRGGGGQQAGAGERGPSGRSAAEIAASMGDKVGVAMHDGTFGTGYEKANAMRHLAGVNAGKATGKQKAEAAEEAAYAARSGEVTVRQATPPAAPAPVDTGHDDW